MAHRGRHSIIMFQFLVTSGLIVAVAATGCNPGSAVFVQDWVRDLAMGSAFLAAYGALGQPGRPTGAWSQSGAAARKLGEGPTGLPGGSGRKSLDPPTIRFCTACAGRHTTR